MIRASVSSSTVFLPNIIREYSHSELAFKFSGSIGSGAICPLEYRDVLFSNGSVSSTTRDSIVSLPDDKYHTLQPIPVVFENTTDGWIAWFEHAGIGMSGATMAEAKELLTHEILDSFTFYAEQEEKLGPGPMAQLKILESYITWEHEQF